MSLTHIGRNTENTNSFALFALGFRPFFLGGSIFAVLSMAAWFAVYSLQLQIDTSPITLFEWHAHEMIYGFSLSIIVGFLLTAVMNWTEVQTIQGLKLFILFICWVVARIALLFGSKFIEIAAVFDFLFILFSILAISYPILITKSWKQIGILTKIFLLGLGNISFYLGYFGILENGVHWSIYGGLYLVISLILTIGSRVFPFFVSKGLDYDINLQSPKWISILSLALFLCFFINELFIFNRAAIGYLSLGLFLVNAVRMYFWHTRGIWSKPLLWSLYLSFLFIDLGFLLFALSYFLGISKYIAIHALAVGGIGLATISMMARVSLGHTGRGVKNPPCQTKYIFAILILGVLTRVCAPLLDPTNYSYWVSISQILWIFAFSFLAIVYGKILVRSRVDGRPG